MVLKDKTYLVDYSKLNNLTSNLNFIFENCFEILLQILQILKTKVIMDSKYILILKFQNASLY